MFQIGKPGKHLLYCGSAMLSGRDLSSQRAISNTFLFNYCNVLLVTLLGCKF
jgi:hypothetical protein